MLSCDISLCDNVVLIECELSWFGVFGADNLQVFLHSVVELPNREHTKFSFWLISMLGLDVYVCVWEGIRVNVSHLVEHLRVLRK